MTSLPRVLLVFALLITLVLVAHCYARWHSAREQLTVASAQIASVQRDADTIRTLRAQDESISLRARPEDDLIPIVHEALGRAGLSVDRLADLRNDADVALPGSEGGPSYRQQSIAFTLRGMSPGDLGAFLNAWRTEQRIWTLSRLTVTAPRDRGARSDDAGRFDIALTVSSLYLGDS